MNRWKAAAIHFSLSLVVFLVLLAIILLVWYPGLLFQLNGGWEGLRIVIGVDLVLGPLLTLIVYKVGKPKLKFDLAAIGIFQALCLAGGVWVVYEERPVVLAIEYDTIYSLSAREFKNQGNALSELDAFPGAYPKFIAIDLPSDNQDAGLLSVERQLENAPLYGDTLYYLPMPTEADAVAALIRTKDSIVSAFRSSQEEEPPQECLLSKFVSSSNIGYVCIDPSGPALTAYYD